MNYLSLFSGYGGFELGIQQAYGILDSTTSGRQSENIAEGVEHNENSSEPTSESREQVPNCIGFSEVNKYAIKTYLKHFPQHKNYGDITTINASELPDFDLLVGGFPCQAFSIAGKRAGFEDTRGTLIYDVFRIIKEKHPQFVLLENVKGLLSHDSGRTFKTIITSLAELGYAIEWQVLNAKNFGVPQNRERVFIIGHLGGFGGRQVFPITGSNPKNLNQIIGGSQGNRFYGIDGISCTQASQAGGQGAKTGLYAVSLQNNRKIATKNEICNTLTSTFRGMPDGDGRPAVLDGIKIRRLTPLEAERLMGLPDQWTEGVSASQRYKLCGNGVVVNVVEEIIKRLKI